MFFGDAQSESPRVPSPWINPTKQRGPLSARTSPGPWAASSTSIGHSPTDSPMSRSVRLRNAELSRQGSAEAVYAAADEDDDSRSGSMISTPLTEAEVDVRIRQEEVDGFFALDNELDTASLHIQQQDDGRPQTPRHLLRLAPEPDMLGNLEYKLRIIPPTRQRYDKLLTQLKWRLLQGGGECTYEVGLLDDGQCLGVCPLEMRASVRVLARMAKELNASLQIGKAFFVDDQAEHVTDQLSPMTAEQARSMLLDHAQQKECSCGVSLDAMRDTLLHLQQGERQDLVLSPSSHWLVDAVDTDVKIDLDDNLEPFKEGVETHELSSGDVVETTFSLSLDEKATQAGVGFRRKVERKSCRYNARNAFSQKQYVTNGSSPIQTVNQACLRVLVEVTLCDGVQTDVFIDYGSF